MTNRALLLLLPFFAAACAEGVADQAVTEGDPTRPVASSGAPSPSQEPVPAPSAPADPDAAAPADDVGSATDAGSATDGGDAGTASDAASPTDAGTTAPTVDGVIHAGEYGTHVDGQNQQASPGTAPTTTWTMTWTDTTLYVGVASANVAEGLVLYVETSPLTPSNGGTNADGSLVGQPYDNTRAATLPFRADFVAYVKSTYQEHRAADGANGWGAAVASGITVAGTGNVRELSIPWTTIRAAGRPSSFSWLGYVTSASGYVYGQMPTGNPGGNVGTSATFGTFYAVADATPGTGTKPFALAKTP